MTSLDKLQPASNRDVTLYSPYCQGNRRSVLPMAISLYQQGNLEGGRRIESGDIVPFVASWNVSSLPADLTRCRLQFDKNSDFSYELLMANFEFMNFLIDVVLSYRRLKIVDFPQTFYRKLLRLED